MPLYEYLCRDCGDRFEVLQRLGEGPEGLSCRECGAAALEKQFSTFAAVTAGGSSAADRGAGMDCGAGDSCGAGACCGGGACGGFDSLN
jgi:putative FmdB family regulatory protein